MLVNDFLRRNALAGAANVEIFAAEPGPMGTAGPEVSAGVRSMIEAHGVTYHSSHQIEEVDAAAGALRFAGTGRTAYDLLLYVPPHRAPAVVRNAGLTGENGWMSVDARTLSTGLPGVYAIGDVTSITLPSGKPLPMAGVFAHAQAEVVAANLAAEWSGETPDHAFDGKGACFIETGRGRAAYGSGDFYADPAPVMTLHEPSRWRHLAKVLFERQWLWKWF
jgi:sulfide:quinone oxidoreductase